MTVLGTNIGSLYAQQALNTNARGLATVMQQLSTGKRINGAADDAAGLAISTRLTSQIRGLDQSVRNANDGISLIQTAEGATEQITNMLQRMRELAVQASNDTNNSADRGFLDGEFQQLKTEINRVASNTQWNGANILDGTGGIKSDGSFAFQVGANANQTISTTLSNLQTYEGVSFGATPVVQTTATTVQTITLGASGTGIDTANANDLNRVVKLNISGTSVVYRITQADLDSVSASQTLSNRVAQGLTAAVNAAQITVGGKAITAAAGAATAYTMTLTAASAITGWAATDTTITSAAGVLNDINTSDILNGTNAYTALGAIDSALQTVNQKRSAMGATISRLQFASDNLSNVSAKAAESKSRIEDTDYSMATTELAKRNIIQQAAQAMLAQANQAPQLVLQLLK